MVGVEGVKNKKARTPRLFIEALVSAEL